MATRLGVVGAGAAAAAATYALHNARPSVEVTVFEKSRGVCGRAAARRRNGIVYDYGANYLSDEGGQVGELVTEAFSEGLVEIRGPIWTFNAEGDVSERPGGGERRWTYEDGITGLAKHLLGAGNTEVQRTTRIVDVSYERDSGRGDGWRLADAEGGEYGPFDLVLLNPPAPQTANLLRDTGVEAANRLGAAAGNVSYRMGWTAVLGYTFEIDVPYYGLLSTDGECEIGWIGREDQKPGHVPDGKSVLVVQARPEWAAARYDANPKENVAHLAECAAQIVGDRRLATPHWTDHQAWRYAFPESAVESTALRDAAREGVYAVGDWIVGEGRLHLAVENGLKTGEAIADARRDCP